MVGIVSYGAYIPIYRLSREAISAMWSQPPGRGERSVVNADEDSLTMGVEAVLDCLNGIDRKQVDALYFSTLSPSYVEKQSASIIRAACDLRPEIVTADISHSLQGATTAMKMATDAVQAGSAKMVMIVASDHRLAAPNSADEANWGDGAAAFLIGSKDVAVSVEGEYHVSSQFIGTWRKPGDRYLNSWEDRFVRDKGYMEILPNAVRTAMRKWGIGPQDITKACYYGPDARTHGAMSRPMGLDVKTQVQDPMFASLGDTGCAFAPMILVAALEDAKPGDTILYASYGDGADVYLLKVQPQIEKVRNRRGIKRHLASKMMLPNYGKYVEIRDMMEWAVGMRPSRRSSLPVIWREREMLYPLNGQKCKKCGNIQFPKQRVCMYCQEKDNFELVRLSDKKGKLFTFSLDERAMEIVLPKVISIVDLEGGGRFYSIMTDRDVSKIDVGMEVEMTFRLQLEGSGLHNYFWRVRPVRC